MESDRKRQQLARIARASRARLSSRDRSAATPRTVRTPTSEPASGRRSLATPDGTPAMSSRYRGCVSPRPGRALPARERRSPDLSASRAAPRYRERRRARGGSPARRRQRRQSDAIHFSRRPGSMTPEPAALGQCVRCVVPWKDTDARGAPVPRPAPRRRGSHGAAPSGAARTAGVRRGRARNPPLWVRAQTGTAVAGGGRDRARVRRRAPARRRLGRQPQRRAEPPDRMGFWLAGSHWGQSW